MERYARGLRAARRACAFTVRVRAALNVVDCRDGDGRGVRRCVFRRSLPVRFCCFPPLPIDLICLQTSSRRPPVARQSARSRSSSASSFLPYRRLCSLMRLERCVALAGRGSGQSREGCPPSFTPSFSQFRRSTTLAWPGNSRATQQPSPAGSAGTRAPHTRPCLRHTLRRFRRTRCRPSTLAGRGTRCRRTAPRSCSARRARPRIASPRSSSCSRNSPRATASARPRTGPPAA